MEGVVCIWILRAGVGTGYCNCHFMPLHQIPHLYCIVDILTKKLAKFEGLKHRRNVQLTFKLFHGLPHDSPGLLWVCQVHHHGGNLDIGCLLLASLCSLLQGSLKEKVGKKLVLKMSQKFIKKQWYISCQKYHCLGLMKILKLCSREISELLKIHTWLISTRNSFPYPISAKWRAVAAPMPLPAPVIRATLSFMATTAPSPPIVDSRVLLGGVRQMYIGMKLVWAARPLIFFLCMAHQCYWVHISRLAWKDGRGNRTSLLQERELDVWRTREICINQFKMDSDMSN